MASWLVRHVGWCVLLGAFVLRVGAAIGLQTYLDRTGPRLCLIAGDAEGYWELAHHLVRGEDFAIYEPPRHVLRMPGFPLLLAASMWTFGENNVFAARLLLASVGAVACWLVFRLGRKLFNERIGAIAGTLAALSPPFVLFSVMLLSETLFAAALLLSLLCLARFVRFAGEHCAGERRASEHRADERRVGETNQLGRGFLERVAERVLERSGAGATDDSRFDGSRLVCGVPTNLAAAAVASGVTLGLAALIRPTWVLIPPLFVAGFLAACWKSSHRCVGGGGGRIAAQSSLLLLLTFGLTMAPWVLRNQRVTGHPIVTTLWSGPSLYDGLRPEADGSSEMSFVEKDGYFRTLSEYEADATYRRLAWQFVCEHPIPAGWLSVLKLGRFWSPIPNATQFEHPLPRAVVLTWFLIAMGGAVVGVGVVRSGIDVTAGTNALPRPWTIVLLCMPIVFLSLVHAVFVGSLRYRLPAEYPLLVLTAVGLDRVWTKWIGPKVARGRGG